MLCVRLKHGFLLSAARLTLAQILHGTISTDEDSLNWFVISIGLSVKGIYPPYLHIFVCFNHGSINYLKYSSHVSSFLVYRYAINLLTPYNKLHSNYYRS